MKKKVVSILLAAIVAVRRHAAVERTQTGMLT